MEGVRPDGKAWPAGPHIIHDGQTHYYWELVDCGSFVRKIMPDLVKTPITGRSFGGNWNSPPLTQRGGGKCFKFVRVVKMGSSAGQAIGTIALL